MRINLVFLSLIIIGGFSIVSAQNTSTSPYSSFGPGEINFGGDIEQSGMGGLSIFSSNPYNASINFHNPAANGKLNVTTFEFAINTRLSQFKDSNSSSKRSATYISNVSLAFPIGNKVKAGFGFQPYSSVGYNLIGRESNQEIEFTKQFDGKGGINSLHFFGSYNATPDLTFGLRANYLFGELSRNQIIAPDNLALVTDYSFETDISGLQLTGGVHYSKRLDDNRRLNIAGTYTLGSRLKADVEEMTRTYSMMGLEPINIDTIRYNMTNGKMKLPQTASIGVSLQKDLHWMIGAQFDWGDWGKYSLESDDNSVFDTGYRVSVGGYWVPQFNSYKSYFDRVTYRLGGFYESTPLKVNNNKINKYGVTFGAGFPIGKAMDASMLNVAVELGQLGNTKNGIIKENFANVKIGFTLNDRWFRKKVID